MYEHLFATYNSVEPPKIINTYQPPTWQDVQVPNLNVTSKPSIEVPFKPDSDNQWVKQFINKYKPVITQYTPTNSISTSSGSKPTSTKIRKFKNKHEFVSTMRPIYKKVLREKGLDENYADYLIAQDAHESGWGNHQAGTFNFGGIKAMGKYKGTGSVKYTKEYVNGKYVTVKQEFRNFKDPEDYARYHVNLLNGPRYRAFNGNFIDNVINGGYATDNKIKYKNSLQSIYNSVIKAQKGVKIQRVNWNSLMKDPQYKRDFNWKIIPKNMQIIEDSLINRKAGFPQRIGVLSQVVPESGGSPAPHKNGSKGIIGYRGPRLIGLPNDLPGQIHNLMEHIFNNPKAKDWTDGGKGTGIKTGKEMRQFFLTTPNVQKATNAFMRGSVRPETSEWNKRLAFAQLLKKHSR